MRTCSHRHVSVEPHLLNVDLNVLLQVVAVQVEHQVVDEVEAVADDDEWQLVGEFGFLFVTHIGREKGQQDIPTNIATPINRPQNSYQT